MNMQSNCWNLRRLATLCSIALAALLALTCLDGCSKSSSSSTTTDGGSDAGGGGGESASGDSASDSNEDDKEPIDPTMFPTVRNMMQLQVDSMVTQVETYRNVEKEHPDAQLTSLLNQMDGKVAEAKKLMEKATTSAQSHVLKVEVPKLLGEAGELGAKVSARLMEVLQAGLPQPATPPAGGGGGDGGGGGGGV